MALPDISLEITANTVAWYAAIVSTIGLSATIYNALKDRRRLRVTVRGNMKLMNAPPYDPNKKYVDITIVNRGRRPARVSSVSVKVYGNDDYAVLSDSIFPQFKRLLTEEEPRTQCFVEQKLMDPARIDYVMVHLETGDTFTSYRRWGARLRRFLSRWT